MLHHQTEVGCDIRLALDGIDNHALGLCRRRRCQFDKGRETSTAHTYDTSGLDAVDYLLWSQFRMSLDRLQFVRAVDTLFPFVAFYIDNDDRLAITCCVDSRINLEDGTADRRVDRSRHEAACLCNQRSHLHLVAFGNDRFGWSSDMLAQGEDGLLRERSHLRYGIIAQFVFFGVYTTYAKCSYIHNGYLLFLFGGIS